MLLIKYIKTRLRERRIKIEEDYLVSEFILKMKEYDINLSRETERKIICNDIIEIPEKRTFEFSIRENVLTVNYNTNGFVLTNIFYNFFNPQFNKKYEKADNSLKMLYKELPLTFNDTHNDYYNFHCIVDQPRRQYVPLSQNLFKGNIMSFFYPRISFAKGCLEKSIVLDCYIEKSPFNDLQDNKKNIFFNIIEKDFEYEINVCERNIYNSIYSCKISKELGFEYTINKIMNIIKSVGLTAKAKEILEINDWREFNEEKAETLRMLYY
jgi:hypothetical protein